MCWWIRQIINLCHNIGRDRMRMLNGVRGYLSLNLRGEKIWLLSSGWTAWLTYYYAFIFSIVFWEDTCNILKVRSDSLTIVGLFRKLIFRYISETSLLTLHLLKIRGAKLLWDDLISSGCHYLMRSQLTVSTLYVMKIIKGRDASLDGACSAKCIACSYLSVKQVLLILASNHGLIE